MTEQAEEWGPWIADFVDCNPVAGTIIWRYRAREHFANEQEYQRWNQRYAHKPAFDCCNERGYRQGSFAGKRYLAHRIIWMAAMGSMPKGEIDHLNGLTGDNRIENLREASRTQNCRNAKLNKDNTSGYAGIHLSGRKWVARIGSGKNREYLGSFTNIDDAIAARRKAEIALGYTERHGKLFSPAGNEVCDEWEAAEGGRMR